MPKPMLWVFPQFQNAYLEQTQEVEKSPPWCSDLWSEGYDDGKGQMEVIRTAFTQENSKLKAIPHSWRDHKDQCHYQLEKFRGSDFCCIPFQLSYLACVEDGCINFKL